MGAVRDSIGQIITRDVDAPIFDVLGVPWSELVEMVRKTNKTICSENDSALVALICSEFRHQSYI